ncbi:MAG: cytochrome c biogenesis protein CcdA [Rhodobacteraceae bacterium]|nr:cytochrome c biogenesis protein CcdA [Paracoccaceae bacterium]
MLDVTFGGAVLAGLLSFFSPCVLPIVPFYLCYMAGISMSELHNEGEIPLGVHRRLVLSAFLFALGVTTIFVLLGLGATALGQAFRMWKQELAYVSAGFLALFGLHFLGVLRIPLLYREARIESTGNPATFVGAYLMGLAFGFGWTPCVGPALAAILMVAAGMGDMVKGSLLLLVYGLAMTLPFVIAALFAKPFLRWMQRNRKYLGYVEKVMGAMLILFAVLIATHSINIIANFMIEYIPWFKTIG